MTGTLAVIALDAADYALLKHWNCKNILLDKHAKLETFTGTREIPLTTEVWPTVATGLPPEEHGIISDGEQQSWENPFLSVASLISARILPDRFRWYAGEFVRSMKNQNGTGMTLSQTTSAHPFPENGIYGWPGLTDAEHLLEAWRWLELVKKGDMSENEAIRRLYENAGKEIGWLSGLADLGFSVLGVHMHILDATGHLYADRESDLRCTYERVDRLIGNIQNVFDDILILSDHGIQVSWLDDENVGSHSMRAFASTTVDDRLPKSVFDVRDWIEQHKGNNTRDRSSGGEMATTEEQLRDLGYIN